MMSDSCLAMMAADIIVLFEPKLVTMVLWKGGCYTRRVKM